MGDSNTSNITLTDLPPEILVKIFSYLSSEFHSDGRCESDLCALRGLAEICTVFSNISVQIPVSVKIPIPAESLSWLMTNRVPVHQLNNREITAYVEDHIYGLNLAQLKTCKLVGYDYQSRKCEVTPHYLGVVRYVTGKSRAVLKRLELNVDLIRGARHFRFAEILCSYQRLQSLSVHFSAHIELSQRITNTDEAQHFIDTVLKCLPTLKKFYIFICPPRKLRISSENLLEFGIFKSDSVEIVGLDLPRVKKLHLHESVIDLLRKVLQDREAEGEDLHRNLLSLIYEGCPNLLSFNEIKLSEDLCGPERLGKREWSKSVNSALVKRFKEVLEAELMF